MKTTFNIALILYLILETLFIKLPNSGSENDGMRLIGILILKFPVFIILNIIYFISFKKMKSNKLSTSLFIFAWILFIRVIFFR